MPTLTSAPIDPPGIDSVVASLRELVVDRSHPGDKLPPEAELAATLAVSRLTIREALKVLAGSGLVELAKGRRAVVRAMDSSVLSDYLAVALRRDPSGYLELNAIRQSLEALSAGAAARTAGAAGMRAIDAALERMRDEAAHRADAPAEELGGYHDADLEFHSAIALAGGNRMLALILDSLSECLRESFVQSARGHLARGGTVQDDLAAHEAIGEAIRARDSARAERLMRAHLGSAERDIRLAMAGRA